MSEIMRPPKNVKVSADGSIIKVMAKTGDIIYGWFLIFLASGCFALVIWIGFKDVGVGVWIIFVYGVIICSLWGISLVGGGSKITFNQFTRQVTFIDGGIPLFLWFLRKKTFSREEARNVHVTRSKTPDERGRLVLLNIKITTASGKEIELINNIGFEDAPDILEYVASRISAFAQGR